MDEKVTRLKTPDECEKFAANVKAKYPNLAIQAQRRAVELRASNHGAVSTAEEEALQAVYAYEETLSRKNGKRTRATRTWQMIERHGILPAVERVVNRDAETVGFTALAEMDMMDFTFESVILRHPQHFSNEVVEKSRRRLADFEAKQHTKRMG